MRGGNRPWAAVLTLGGVVTAAGGVVIDMPASPGAARPGAERPEPSESAPAPKLGDVALDRYARARSAPSYTFMASPAWWGWPYGRYGYGYGVFPSWGWGWYGWGHPYFGGYRFRHLYHRHPWWGYRWRGSRFTFRWRP